MSCWSEITFVNDLLLTVNFIITLFSMIIFLYAIYSKMHRKNIIKYASVLVLFYIFLASSIFSYWQVNRAASIPQDDFLIVRYFPLWLYILVCIIEAAVIFIEWREVKTWRKTRLNRLSLKEAIDTLPTALLFYGENGMVYLANHKMQSIANKFTGSDIFNGNDFLSSVRNKALYENTETLSDDPLVIKDRSGVIWQFSEGLLLNNIHMLTATDITELWIAGEKLKQGNEQLERLNDRLKNYQDEIQLLVKEDELLNAKIRVHDDLGQVLLSTRKYISDGSPEDKKADIIKQWKNVIWSLENVDGLQVKSNPLDELQKACGHLGIRLNIKGIIPENDSFLHLLLSAARECLTNAAHAGADIFEIEINDTKYETTAIFRNNGIEPEYPIKEGGGISSLRQLVMKNGANIELADSSPFYLKLSKTKTKEL